MKNILFAIKIIFFILFGFSSCSGEDKSSINTNDFGNIYNELISAHTSGVISRNTQFRVVFRNEVVSLSEVNKLIEDSPLNFNPSVIGKTKWISKNVLAFDAEELLPSNQSFSVNLNLNKIYNDIPDSLSRFNFSFSTLKQELNIDQSKISLVAQSNNNVEFQKLSGLLTTSDFDYPSNIEECIKAKIGNKSFNIKWEHKLDRKESIFFIDSIQRIDNSQELSLLYDASSLGLKKRGEYNFKIRALGEFEVDKFDVISYPDQCILIKFSDPLDVNQNLDGLIWIPKIKVNLEINNSEVKVYPKGNHLVGDYKLNIESGIRNIKGFKNDDKKSYDITFKQIKPELELVGNKTIIPNSKVIPFNFRAVGLSHVDLRVIKIDEDNVPQFLQVNGMSGTNELKRVGHVITKTRISLNKGNNLDLGSWNVHSLDLSSIINTEPGAIYEVALGFKRSYSLYQCADTIIGNDVDMLALDDWYLPDQVVEEQDDSYWDYYDEYDDYDNHHYSNKSDPCENSYYSSDKAVKRNIIASSVGLIAKRGTNNEIFVIASDLQNCKPLENTKISILNYQQHEIATGVTNSDGMVRIKCKDEPYLVIASYERESGYLKIDRASSLSLSKFDIGGKKINKGINGYLFGERGVWRPGDNIYLNFILEDRNDQLPSNHPIVFELFNSKGQLVKRDKNLKGLNDFYAITCKTDENDPTGNYRAKVHVGGVTFQKVLKIETVVPNRLKMKLDFGVEYLTTSDKDLETTLEAKWLHGAAAKQLRANVSVSLSNARTKFNIFKDYTFKDPVNSFNNEYSNVIFDGDLDDNGQVSISPNFNVSSEVPGILNANFTTKVFEPGGNFSTDRFTIPYHKYDQYIGMKLPKGDVARGMLLTDTTHTVKLALINNDGTLGGDGEAEVSIYQIDWKWWWDQSAYSMPQYYGRFNYSPISSGKVNFKNGEAEWKFKINYPSWGRYLVRACDKNGHCTGKIVYIDWPGWAGRAQQDGNNGGAKMLVFSAEKKNVNVGEDVVLNIPTTKKGRALVSIESGSKVLNAEWISGTSGMTKYTFKATAEMAPNIYAHVTLVQPHEHYENNRPMRLYGVIPINVQNPKSKLKPILDIADVIEPDSKVSFSVSEKSGSPMTYVVAVVDEGLLGLTRFSTPNPWSHFYRKMSLDVMSWDLYDDVMGGAGVKVRNLLGIGGGDEDVSDKEGQKSNRFKPVVKFFGPYHNSSGEKKKISFDMPNYVGAVRTMVIARHKESYGSTSKESLVKKPIMVLASLPRELTPNDVIDLPVTVFCLDEKIKDVNVSIKTNSFIEILDKKSQVLTFDGAGDQMAHFRIKVKDKIGMANIEVLASGSGEKASFYEDVKVRTPNPMMSKVDDLFVEGNKSGNMDFSIFGLEGTNKVTLEVSSIPPIDLEKRLGSLIRYPHGCVEQTTSSVFPQVYLARLLTLSQDKKAQVSKNIEAGIQRLMSFQTHDGGLSYWPGGHSSNEWGTNYAGNFLIEAKNAGYKVSEDFMSKWISFQENKASSWFDNNNKGDRLTQTYRLYLLALLKSPDLGAMNRMRMISEQLDNRSRAYLASAYALTGDINISEKLLKSGDIKVEDYAELSGTYGSSSRDKAILLETCIYLNRLSDAHKLAKELTGVLSSNEYLSTQSTAYSLIGIAKFHGDENKSLEKFAFELNENGTTKTIRSSSVMYSDYVSFNTSKSNRLSFKNLTPNGLYFRLINQGIPLNIVDTLKSDQISLNVTYLDMDGDEIYVDEIEQGTDFVCRVNVQNKSNKTLEEMALTNVFPSAWEIYNDRLNGNTISRSNSFEYQNIRDTKVYTYFDIKPNNFLTFVFNLNASYTGDYYLPPVHVEAMYDAEISTMSNYGRTKVFKENSTVANSQ